MKETTQNKEEFKDTIESMLQDYAKVHQQHTDAIFALLKKVYKLGFNDGIDFMKE